MELKIRGNPRILVLTSTFPRWPDDDEPPFVYELCRRLTENFEVHVLAPHCFGAARREVLSKVNVHRFRYFAAPWENLAYQGGILTRLQKQPGYYALLPFFLLSQLLVTCALLNRDAFHLIHAHWLIPQGVTAILARWLTANRIPVLCTSHGGDLYGLHGNVMNRMKTAVLQKVNRVTVVSRAMQTEVLQLGVPRDRVKVIPMGVDLKKRFIPPVQKTEGQTLLYVGRLVEKKGLIHLIEALPQILRSNPRTQLWIVGDGPERSRLQHRCEALGVGDRVYFKGAVNNAKLPEMYAAADVVVFPSVVARGGDREGFGLVLVESLGSGCAAVVSDLPAMRDIVADGKTGLVVPQKNAGAIAAAVNRLLEDKALRRRLGIQGRRFVLQRYDWDVIAERYGRLIGSMIDA